MAPGTPVTPGLSLVHDQHASLRPAPDHALDDVAMICLGVDAAGVIRWANKAAVELVRQLGARRVGATLMDLLHRDERRDIERLVRDAPASRSPVQAVVRLLESGDHDDRHAHLVLSSPSPAGPGLGPRTDIVVQAWDVSFLVRRIHELEAHADRDPLTGLANRAAFMNRLRHEIARSVRTGADVAVLFADVDGLKAVNDTYGHEAGDDVLMGLGRRLAESLRPEDTLARMGGDEFAVVCADLLDLDQALTLAERLRAAAAEPIAIRGGHLSVTVSVGVAVGSSAEGDDVAARLLRRADEAMYDIKPRRSPMGHVVG